MKNPLKYEDLESLAQSRPAPDNFGPGSDFPLLAFDLENSSTIFSAWLRQLPCPVIGIGSGALSESCDTVLETSSKLPFIAKNVQAAPIAAMALTQLLRFSGNLSLRQALTAESFAYASVQTGPEFMAWRDSYRPPPDHRLETSLPLRIDYEGNHVSLMFNRPQSRNAIDVEMRDALCEAFDLIAADPDIKTFSLTGNGKTFSTGGDLSEFGSVTDPATAHWIRSLRLPASRLINIIDKSTMHINGAAIGAGLEIAAFGTNITASRKAWFQLPELKYGLIPGAGGTVSLPRRIGRQRAAYMALTMDKIKAETALDWGLVDSLTD